MRATMYPGEIVIYDIEYVTGCWIISVALRRGLMIYNNCNIFMYQRLNFFAFSAYALGNVDQ